MFGYCQVFYRSGMGTGWEAMRTRVTGQGNKKKGWASVMGGCFLYLMAVSRAFQCLEIWNVIYISPSLGLLILTVWLRPALPTWGKWRDGPV